MSFVTNSTVDVSVKGFSIDLLWRLLNLTGKFWGNQIQIIRIKKSALNLINALSKDTIGLFSLVKIP